MKSTVFTAALALATASTATLATAEAVKYELDASHSQIVFSYDHQGFSTTYGMFSGFNGEIMFDEDAPAASSVRVDFPVMSMFTGWEKRFAHFMSPDFFDANEDESVSFASTSINVTGDETAEITGDLTLNGVTKSVVLNAKINKIGKSRGGNALVGFDGETTLMRSDYNLGKFAPFVSDEVKVMISLEAEAAE